MISRALEWDINHVKDVLSVKIFCSARIRHATGETRSYWATDTHYPYNKGVRRDMVEVDLTTKHKKKTGQVVITKKTGVTQLVAFIRMTHVPPECPCSTAKCVLIRWMSVSSRSRSRDDEDRPLCEYPLGNNHCLWQWSDSKRNRKCLTTRGAKANIQRQHIYDRFPIGDQDKIIRKEVRARYDIIEFACIKGHANITVDPSTGHMLQTLQII